MTYQELTQSAISSTWAAEELQRVNARNVEILRARQLLIDARRRIGVGDFVIDGEKTLRVAHDWGDCIQLTDGVYGASFYLGDGYVEFSGGLNPGIDTNRFAATDETREGSVWFFSENWARAHNGYHTKATFRVWRLVGGNL